MDMFGGAGIGYSLFGRPQFMFPPGYNSKAATARIARQFSDPDSSEGSPWASLGNPGGDGSAKSNGGPNAESARDQVSSAQVDHRSAVWQDREKSVDVAAGRKQGFDAFSQVEELIEGICR